MPFRESDGFDHDLVVDALQVLLRITGVVEVGESQVAGDAVLRHELPHERLRGLDPGGRLGGRGAGDASRLEGVDDPLLKRCLGTDR